MLIFHYPETNCVKQPNCRIYRRSIQIQRVRDLLAEPLTAEEFLRRPYAVRSRTLVRGRDLDRGGTRQFYLGRTPEFESPTNLHVGTFDTDTGELLRLLDRGYQATVVDRDVMIERMPIWESALVAGERLGIFASDMRIVR